MDWIPTPADHDGPFTGASLKPSQPISRAAACEGVNNCPLTGDGASHRSHNSDRAYAEARRLGLIEARVGKAPSSLKPLSS